MSAPVACSCGPYPPNRAKKHAFHWCYILLFQETSPCVGCCRRRRAQKECNTAHVILLLPTLGCFLLLGLVSSDGGGEEARAALSTAVELYRAMDMTFWLPQAEAALAHV